METDTKTLLDNVTPADLKSFGMIPELIGRFPVITHTNPLLPNDLSRIIEEPHNSILKQYQKLAHIDGKTLVFSPGAIDAIADAAFVSGTGARGLRGILETVLTEFMFDAPDSKSSRWVVDLNYVKKALDKTAGDFSLNKAS